MSETTPPASGWQRLKLIVKVVEVRLRFVAVLVVTGLVIGYWDTLKNYWDKWTRPAKVATGQVFSDTEFFCPMHPSVVRSGLEPNGEVPKCPICGMSLSQRKKGVGGQGAANGRVQLSPERIALAGVATEVIGFKKLERELVTSGSVKYDEARLSRIVARVSGYLEKLYLNKSFVPVEAGEPLAEIYSPELFTAVRELILAASSGRATELVVAARERLRRLGIDDREIDDILASKKTDYKLVIRSPQSGHVIQRDVVRGSYVTTGASLMEVADLSKVWIEADVFEKDVPFLRESMTVEAWVEAVPNRVFTGTISLVHPHVEAATRTNPVRFSVDNPGCVLRPGMFATVRIKTPLLEISPWKSMPADTGIVSSSGVLSVPERAVIDTGSKQLVYVEREPGVFFATRVELGPRVGEDYPVLSGVRAGERIATAGAFLVDAETRLNPAAAATFAGASGPSKASDTAKPDDWKELSPEDRKLAHEQRTCPISGDLLGSMGTPFKTTANGKVVFLCCEGCKPKLDAKGAGQ